MTRLEKLRENVAARINRFDFETIWTSGVNSGLSVALSIIDAAIAEERSAKDERHDCAGCALKHAENRPCAVCERAYPREPGYADYYKREPAFEDHDFYVYDDARPEPAKPDPGDVVAYVFADGTVTLDRYDDKPQYNGRLVVLMRAADVRAAIRDKL